MGQYVIKMPDIGEGIAEVELVEWHVKVGDVVAEEQVLADVMTDKANVEIPSHVAGKVDRPHRKARRRDRGRVGDHSAGSRGPGQRRPGRPGGEARGARRPSPAPSRRRANARHDGATPVPAPAPSPAPP
jgi:2-oxoisovalerate dehydrogenase E2 component (dihydrolipoyl transacylase)